MKKIYDSPELSVVCFSDEDVITTSGLTGTDIYDRENTYEDIFG